MGNPLGVTLLTGGHDRPYVLGLAPALMSQGAALDLIGGDDLDFATFHSRPEVNFLNLRGDQRPDAGFAKKVFRVLLYYVRLVRYAATARPTIFHILWNNKFESFDRTLLMLYYKALGKRIALTAHNVNKGRRDGNDTLLNRITLRIQYRLADHIFVHTEKMKEELIEDFGVQGCQVTVIPFGINNSVPNTSLTSAEARQRLGIREGEKTILFFGNITPYKGLEYIVQAFQRHLARPSDYRLIIAGVPKNCEKYWAAIRDAVREDVQRGRILLKAEFVPDEEMEVYFKAGDVLVLPYRHIYESGVLYTGHNFGLPALVSDVGSLKAGIVEGKTGYIFRPEDPGDLARAIEEYFASDLFAHLSSRRQEIRDYAMQQHSWETVAQMILIVYNSLREAPCSATVERQPSSR
jgi:D-inositol-3-phosphate glycosyltransferase